MSTEAHERADAPASLRSLQEQMEGRLVLPDDEAFDADRRPWNLAVEQRPAAVAHPAGVDDLRAVLRAAREAGLAVAVQPNGHGASSALEGAVLVRAAAFDHLEVDADARVARIGAGVPWGPVLQALEGTGLGAPSGTSRVVSATGYALGGGHGWLAREAGLGAHGLRAVRVLRPDGSLDRVDDASDPEAMWAMRGGGGIAGVVTGIELDLHPVPSLVRAELVVDGAQAGAALRALRDAAEARGPEGADRALGLFATSMRMPDAPQVPEPVRGRTLLTIEALGPDEASLAFLDGVRAATTPEMDAVAPTTQLQMAMQAMEPTDPSPSRGASVALGGLDDAVIDAMLGWRSLPEQAGLIGIGMRLLGGAVDEPRRPAFATLEGARWLVMGLAPLLPGVPPEPGLASLAGLSSVLAPNAAPRMIQTFLGEGETLDACGTPDALARLRAARDAADPDRLMHEGRLPR